MALTRMQQRRGVASQWASENPILGAGEIGYEIDNNRFKIGDGITNWSGLEYFSNKEDVDAAIASAIADVIDLAPETLDTLNEIAAAINDDPDFFNTIATSLGTKVSKAGDTMTGDLTLPNDPTQNLHAATKQYVDQSETDAKSYTDAEISSLISSGETITPGGTEGQVLTKASDADYDTEWIDPTGLLGDLEDVQTYEVSDKDTLVYDEALGIWLPGPGGGRFNVSETQPTEPLNGDTWLDSITGNTYLYYEDLDSPQWIQIGGPGITVTRGSSLFVQTTSPGAPVEGDIWYDPTEGFTYLYYTDTDSSQWIQFGLNRNGAPGDSLSSIDEITDVNVSSPANGESLVYDGTEWVNETLDLTDLTDTTISSPSEGDTMVYDGSSWINTPATSGNAIINGDFGVSQRGASFANPSNNDYTLDRWNVGVAGGSPTDVTVSQESFTPGDVEAIGYGDGGSFARIDLTDVGTMTVFQFRQYVEDVRTFAGQQVTLSFWAKANSAIELTPILQQNFGSGGSSSVTEVLPTQTLSTSWQRFSLTVSLGSLSGKTIGSGSYLVVRFDVRETNGNVYDIWGVQLEAGPVATPFRLSGGGSKAAELALCQRYYEKSYNVDVAPGTSTTAGVHQEIGGSDSGGKTTSAIPFAVNKRISPTITLYSSTGVQGDWLYFRNGIQGEDTASAPFVGETRMRVDVVSGASWTAPVGVRGHFVADAEL